MVRLAPNKRGKVILCYGKSQRMNRGAPAISDEVLAATSGLPYNSMLGEARLNEKGNLQKKLPTTAV